SQTPAKVRQNRTGWKREYETVFVLPHDQTDEAAEKLAARMREVVVGQGGRVVKFTYWGRKKTAFELKKGSRALYVQMAYLGDGKAVFEVERQLRNAEEVVRFQTGLVNRHVDPEARPTEEDVKLAGDLDERAARPERPEGVPDVDAIGEEPMADDVGPEAPAVE
ncbi:MAG: 30S ribosomal protein S6, partial [Deltaproteobacteria bacterium]